MEHGKLRQSVVDNIYKESVLMSLLYRGFLKLEICLRPTDKHLNSDFRILCTILNSVAGVAQTFHQVINLSFLPLVWSDREAAGRVCDNNSRPDLSSPHLRYLVCAKSR